jgi:uncharacterized membrane protein
MPPIGYARACTFLKTYDEDRAKMGEVSILNATHSRKTKGVKDERAYSCDRRIRKCHPGEHGTVQHTGTGFSVGGKGGGGGGGDKQ